MWIEALKNGKYAARETYIDPRTGKTKKVSITIAKNNLQSRKAAGEELRRRIAERIRDTDEKEITIKELSELYIIHQKNTVKSQTYQRDKVMARKVAAVLGTETLVCKLTARYIVQRLESSKHENVTRNTYLEHIKRMLKWGYRSDYIESVAYLDKIKPWADNKKERIEDKYLTGDELSALLNGMKVTKWKLLTQFLALSGLRIGEALALLDADVKDVITVNKTMDVRNGTITDSAKTDAGNREVFVQEELIPVIAEIRKEKKLDQLAEGYRTDRFFYDCSYFAYNKYLKENSLSTINHPITPHALRHTHVSLLAEQGVPLEVISRRVGHEDSAITRRIYLHVTEKQKERDKEKVNKIRLLG